MKRGVVDTSCALHPAQRQRQNGSAVKSFSDFRAWSCGNVDALPIPSPPTTHGQVCGFNAGGGGNLSLSPELLLVFSNLSPPIKKQHTFEIFYLSTIGISR